MIKTSYPASSQQQGIWFDTLTKSSSHWSFSSVKCFNGIINIDSFFNAVRLAVEKHSALRTNFELDNDILLQVVSNEIDIEQCIKIIQLPENSDSYFSSLIITEINKLHNKSYDLSSDILFNILLIQHEDAVVIDIDIHHIIVDTMSMSLFWKDLSIYYNLLIQNEAITHDDKLAQYWQYSIDQHACFSSEKYKNCVKYWSDKFITSVPVFNNPFKSNDADAIISTSEVLISKDVVDNIRSFSLKNRLTFSSVFLFSYAVLLYKYSGLFNFLITNVIHGRGIGKKNYRDVIGLFANRIINGINIVPGESIIDQLKQVNLDLVNGFNQSDFPYEQLIRDVKEDNPKTDIYSNVSFNLIKSLGSTANFNGLRELGTNFWGDEKIRFPRGDHDLILYVIDHIDHVRLRFDVKCDSKWGPATDLLAEAFVKILNDCVANPLLKVKDLDLLSNKERHIIDNANSTDTLSANDAIPVLWNNSLKKHLLSTAIVCNKHIITYQQLDEMSNAIAAHLVSAGIQCEEIVGVFIGRNQYLIAALLGILKAGAAYLPLDPEYPADRLNYMLFDAKVKIVLTDKKQNIAFNDVSIIDITDTVSFNKNYVSPPINIEQLAYVIYTSGSTGRPKGVMIEHGSVVNFILAIGRIINFEAKRLYSLTTVSFDIFLLEYLATLCNGGTLVLGSEQEQRDSISAVEKIAAEKIDIFQCTPSRLKLILSEFPDFGNTGLTDILMGGEPLDKMLASALLKETKNNVYNMYGPTETTVWSCYKKLTYGEDVTIGKPIDNTKIHILNNSFTEQGIGVFGEICISGLGLARGYLNQPELTSAKFIKSAGINEQLYRTGDRGRWLLNGDLQIGGRSDQQVKIRGYRIELAEIEHCLKEHNQIADAVIVSDFEQESVYAFVIGDNLTDPEILRGFLKEKLPAYMVPSAFIKVDEFPKTLNEKIDREALKQKIKQIAINDDATSLSFNSVLINEWKAILKASQIDDYDLSENFFEAGGHSLSALKLLRKIDNNLGIKIPLRDFFENPTILFLNEKIKISS